MKLFLPRRNNEIFMPSGLISIKQGIERDQHTEKKIKRTILMHRQSTTAPLWFATAYSPSKTGSPLQGKDS